MKNKALLLALIAGVVGGVLGAKLFVPAGNSSAPKETAFERVIRTKTLRCGYVIYPTFVEKDPTTGKFSGLFYDVMTTLGDTLGIKIEWAADVGTDNIFEGFKTSQYDALCAGYWRTAGRAHGGDFSRPVVFTPTYLYVRADDTQIKTPEDLNSPNVTISVMDGEGTNTYIRSRFSQAKINAMPGSAPAGQRLLEIANHKADATAIEGSIGAAFMAANPGKIRQLSPQPFVTGASVVIIPHGEQDLKSFLDAGIAVMEETGELARITAKYQKYPGSVLLPSSEFKVE